MLNTYSAASLLSGRGVSKHIHSIRNPAGTLKRIALPAGINHSDLHAGSCIDQPKKLAVI